MTNEQNVEKQFFQSILFFILIVQKMQKWQNLLYYRWHHDVIDNKLIHFFFSK
jgi:hypothetical protein